MPAEVDPSSGYRYYAPEQVPLARVVRRFRDLGMPLEQIREVLSTSDGGPRLPDAARLTPARLTPEPLTPERR